MNISRLNKYVIKYFFLLCSTSDYSQLTTFFEDWEIRNYSVPVNVTQSTEIASNSTVNINVNLSNQIGDVLPTHFGTNLTHFLGESSLNETDFVDNLNNLGDVFFRYPGGNGSNQFFWDGNVPSSILNDDQITVNDLSLIHISEPTRPY